MAREIETEGSLKATGSDPRGESAHEHAVEVWDYPGHQDEAREIKVVGGGGVRWGAGVRCGAERAGREGTDEVPLNISGLRLYPI